MDRLRVFAPATIGNVGPGFDILGLAVEGLGDEFLFTRKHENSPTKITVSGRDANLVPLDVAKNTVTIAAQALCESMGTSLFFDVHIDRKLPLSGGLGASAASSLAGAFGAAKLLGSLSEGEILKAALAGEEAVAGRHLDNIAPCFYGGLTLIRDVEIPIVDTFRCHPFWVTLVTPSLKLNTKDSRSVLDDHIERTVWVRQMAHAAALVQGLITGREQLVKGSVVDHFAEPKRGPLIEGFMGAKDRALSAGALGCSISGGGPSIFALSESKKVAETVKAAMVQAFDSVAVAHVGKIANQGISVISENRNEALI